LVEAEGAKYDAVSAQIEADLVTFAPEIGWFFDALMPLVRAQIEAAQPSAFVDPADLEQLRRDTVVILDDVGWTSGLLGPAWLRGRLPALAAIAPAAATILCTDERAYFAEVASGMVGMIGNAAAAAGFSNMAGILRGLHLFPPVAGVH
jgi:hypothetical protein